MAEIVKFVSAEEILLAQLRKQQEEGVYEGNVGIAELRTRGDDPQRTRYFVTVRDDGVQSMPMRAVRNSGLEISRKG